MYLMTAPTKIFGFQILHHINFDFSQFYSSWSFLSKHSEVQENLYNSKRNVFFKRIILIHIRRYASFLRHFEALPGNSYIRTSVRSTVVFILLGSGCWWELDSWNPPQAGWVK